jgi:hypothetical protein
MLRCFDQETETVSDYTKFVGSVLLWEILNLLELVSQWQEL